MFYYYGRKKKLGHLYPTATHDVIVEPFAGSAAYACRPEHRDREVILVERDPLVAELWRRLLAMSVDEVLSMPELEVGESTTDPLHIMHAASKRAFDYRRITVTKVLAANWRCGRRAIAEALPHVRHWTIVEGDYTAAPDVEATWFVDPPYQGAPGSGYRFGSDLLDYPALGDWCRERRGQAVVCEQVGADWLPFVPLAELVGVAGKRSAEAVWLRDTASTVNVC